MPEEHSDKIDWKARYLELKKQHDRFKEHHSQQLAGLVHDARGYMTGILCTIELIKTSGLDPQQTADADAMMQSILDTNTLFEQCLIRAKLEAGEVQVSKRPFAIQELLQAVHKTHEAKARKRQLVFECDIHAQCPPVFIGDPFLIKRVLANLVDNAIKYTNEGGVYVLARYDSGDRLLRLFIRDTGIGVDPDDQTRIFRIFQQSDHSLLPMISPGFGIGLYICNELIALMHGSIDLESIPEKGSTFIVTLPIPHMT